MLRDEEFENINPGVPRILLPEGLWVGKLREHDKKQTPWGEKLVLCWEIYQTLEMSGGVTLERYYNVTRDRGGRLQFGDCHDYRRDWIAANGGKHPVRRESLSLRVFEGRCFLVAVVTVKHDGQKRPLNQSCYYSKVGWIKRPVDEGETFEALPAEPLNFTKGRP